MDPILTSALISAGLGLAKNELFDRPKQEQELMSRAISTRFAPLKGVAGPGFQGLPQADAAQTMLDFGLSGASFAQRQQESTNKEAILREVLGLNNGNGMSPEQSQSILFSRNTDSPSSMGGIFSGGR